MTTKPDYETCLNCGFGARNTVSAATCNVCPGPGVAGSKWCPKVRPKAPGSACESCNGTGDWTHRCYGDPVTEMCPRCRGTKVEPKDPDHPSVEWLKKWASTQQPEPAGRDESVPAVRYRAVTERIVGCLSTYYFPPENESPANTAEEAMQSGIDGQIKIERELTRWTPMRIVEVHESAGRDESRDVWIHEFDVSQNLMTLRTTYPSPAFGPSEDSVKARGYVRYSPTSQLEQVQADRDEWRKQHDILLDKWRDEEQRRINAEHELEQTRKALVDIVATWHAGYVAKSATEREALLAELMAQIESARALLGKS